MWRAILESEVKIQWAPMLRWSIVTYGVLVAWLIPYQQYAPRRVFVSLALVGLGAMRNDEAVNGDRSREAKTQPWKLPQRSSRRPQRRRPLGSTARHT